MTEQEFDKLVDERCAKIKQTLLLKAKEYRRNENPLHNFESGARIINNSKEKVLKGFMLKHLISIFDIIDDLDYKKLPTREMIQEKCGDAINYLILLEASLNDTINAKNF